MTVLPAKLTAAMSLFMFESVLSVAVLLLAGLARSAARAATRRHA
jgi:hypothetical protein